MAEIHDGLAGRRQILLRNLVEPSARLHRHPRPAQYRQMAPGAFVATAAGSRQFRNGAWLAHGQFLEHFPARLMGQNFGESFPVGQRRDHGSFRNG